LLHGGLLTRAWAACGLYAAAQVMLKKVVEERLLRLRGVVGFWPANAVGEGIAVYADEAGRRISPVSTPCASR
jgi:cobalamin-dependent methionine synthase I